MRDAIAYGPTVEGLLCLSDRGRDECNGGVSDQQQLCAHSSLLRKNPRWGQVDRVQRGLFIHIKTSDRDDYRESIRNCENDSDYHLPCCSRGSDVEEDF